MKVLLNYADGKFLHSQLLNSQTGLASGFNVVYNMGRSDIDADFMSKNSDILSQKRGVGYWLWKPYFITKILSTLTPDDILFYSDSGSVFIRRMDPVFDEVRLDGRGVVAFNLAGTHLEKYYTKRDVFTYMDAVAPEYTDTPQRMASFMCFRGTDFARSLAHEYLSLCCNPKLIMDGPNEDGWIEPGFVDHRHDQSIWSLLTKKHSISIMPDPTQWGVKHRENGEEHQFLIHTRDPR